MNATHFIHIGRNKCASTTLQYFFLTHAPMLAAHGIDHFPDAATIKRFAPQAELRSDAEHGDYVRAHPDRATLLSNEWLMALPEELTRTPFEALGGAPCKIIAYIRDYASWMRSNYAEAAASGLIWSNFDQFYADTLDTASAMPSLSAWGARVGWNCMHVRALDPRTLYKGDVIRDCGRALGLPDDAVDRASRQNMNETPHWISIELVRAARATCASLERKAFRRVKRPLMNVAEEAVRKYSDIIPAARYLSADQAGAMTELYNADARALSDLLGAPAPNLDAPPPGRDFLPTIEAAPRPVRDEILRRVSAPEFAASHPAARIAAEAALAGLQ
jgi:hypothetical protein